MNRLLNLQKDLDRNKNKRNPSPARHSHGTRMSRSYTGDGGISDISQRGLEFIARWEGFEPQIYINTFTDPQTGRQVQDPATIGYGHVIRPGEDFSQGITEAQALVILRQDAQSSMDVINRLVTTELNQHQFDALTSYVFNTGSLGGTRLLRNLNAGDFANAAAEMDINTAGGVYVQGLENRRIEERNIFLNGY